LRGRIYFAVDKNRYQDFLTELQKLMRSRTFELNWKISSKQTRFEAGDTSVLYFGAEDSRAVYELVDELWLSRQRCFRDTTPPLAARIMDSRGCWMRGISFAQSVSGHSFNGNISNPIAAAMHGMRLREYVRRLGGHGVKRVTRKDAKRAIVYAMYHNGVLLDHPAFTESGLEAFSYIAQRSGQRRR
jgi:hypothetical protein